jgi:hypothetical protein
MKKALCESRGLFCLKLTTFTKMKINIRKHCDHGVKTCPSGQAGIVTFVVLFLEN